MHGLQIPLHLSRHRIHGDQRVPEQIRAGPVSAVAIVAGPPDRHQQRAGLGVHGKRAPYIYAGAILPAVIEPGLMPDFSRLRNRMERPDQFPGGRIPGADIATPAIRAVVLQVRSGEHQILVNRGRAVQSVGSTLEARTFHPGFQIELAFLGETRHQLAGASVHPDQEAVFGAEENRRRSVLVSRPVSDPARGARGVLVIERPDGLSRLGFHGDQALKRRDEVHHAVHHQRRGLRLLLALSDRGGWPGFVFPGLD